MILTVNILRHLNPALSFQKNGKDDCFFRAWKWNNLLFLKTISWNELISPLLLCRKYWKGYRTIAGRTEATCTELVDTPYVDAGLSPFKLLLGH